MSIIAYAADPDFKAIYFITPRRTRKYDNIMLNNNVALFIDNAHNEQSDIQNATGITAKGIAIVLDENECIEGQEQFIKKHPQLKKFAEAEDSSMIKIAIDRYEIVENFQQVSTIKAEEL